MPLAALLFAWMARPAVAAEYLLEGISCIKSGLCTPCDLIQVGVNGTEMMLGFSGVAVLGAFLYGGILWMTSYGNSKKVDSGKSAIKAAVIGMAIIFLSYSIVQLVWQAFITDKEFRTEFGCKEYSLPVRDPQKNLPVAEDQAVQDPRFPVSPQEPLLMENCGGEGEPACQDECWQYCWEEENMGGEAITQDGLPYCRCKPGL